MPGSTIETLGELWLGTPVPEALKLQRPLANELLQIVATGEREDALAA
jgi:hypothetical protein